MGKHFVGDALSASIYTFVFEPMGAPFSMRMSTTSWWPDLAAQWRGVRPSLVFASMFAPLLIRRLTILILPHFAATCIGVILCCKCKKSKRLEL